MKGWSLLLYLPPSLFNFPFCFDKVIRFGENRLAFHFHPIFYCAMGSLHLKLINAFGWGSRGWATLEIMGSEVVWTNINFMVIFGVARRGRFQTVILAVIFKSSNHSGGPILLDYVVARFNEKLYRHLFGLDALRDLWVAQVAEREVLPD